jgi:hypothetical protein
MYQHYRAAICADHRTERRRIRSGTDRRKTTFKSVVWTSVRGRRRQARRSHDSADFYIDQYETSLLYIAATIFVLSCADATFTLTLMQRGAAELNGIMAVLIEADPRLFAVVKSSITGVSLLVLVAHARFRLFRVIEVSRVPPVFLVIYIALIAYELSLLYA